MPDHMTAEERATQMQIDRRVVEENMVTAIERGVDIDDATLVAIYKDVYIRHIREAEEAAELRTLRWCSLWLNSQDRNYPVEVFPPLVYPPDSKGERNAAALARHICATWPAKMRQDFAERGSDEPV